jgi:chromosomal replication initiator protein
MDVNFERVVLLKGLASNDHVLLQDDVATYIAGLPTVDLRDLEGTLIRLIAYASLTKQELSLPFAREVLGKMFRKG